MKNTAFMRIVGIFIVLAMITAIFAACGDQGRIEGAESDASGTEKQTSGTENGTEVQIDETVDTIRVGTLIGPTGMGMAYLMKTDILLFSSR